MSDELNRQMVLVPDELAQLRGFCRDAQRLTAQAQSQLAASWEREKAQDQVIRDLRRELLVAHDIAGRAEGMSMTTTPAPFPRTHDFGGDRRRVGG